MSPLVVLIVYTIFTVENIGFHFSVWEFSSASWSCCSVTKNVTSFQQIQFFVCDLTWLSIVYCLFVKQMFHTCISEVLCYGIWTCISTRVFRSKISREDEYLITSVHSICLILNHMPSNNNKFCSCNDKRSTPECMCYPSANGLFAVWSAWIMGVRPCSLFGALPFLTSFREFYHG